VRFQWSNLWAVIKALDKNGVPVGLDAEGNIRVTPESRVEVTASGFKPQSAAEAWVFSMPTRIGAAAVGTDGKTTGTFSLPKKLAAGSHRIVLLGLDPSGKQVKFTLGITVVEPPQPASRTVIVVLILAATGFALFIPPVRRRRRRAAA
jgi:Mrp family chromosome partitioning ATPase